MLPILVPESNFDPQVAYALTGPNTTDPVRVCGTGEFRFTSATSRQLTDNVCPNGAPVLAFQCQAPAFRNTNNTFNFSCFNNSTNNSFLFARLPSDGRAYNKIVRLSNGPIITVDTSGQLINAYYRMHTRNTITGSDTCREPSSTLQIGCLVAADNCSIGFAGRDAFERVPAAGGLQLNGVSPLPQEARDFLAGDTTAYPFSRFLWVNTLYGFGNIATNATVSGQDADQAALATCFATRTIVDVSAIRAGFVTLSDSPGTCSVSGTVCDNGIAANPGEFGPCPAGETCNSAIVAATDYNNTNCAPSAP
ncbi:MAG: hypothetical protein HC923_08455 [Myxococcales bacterium]|nr:hypothetical protein [Myxococcales bacterium]